MPLGVWPLFLLYMEYLRNLAVRKPPIQACGSEMFIPDPVSRFLPLPVPASKNSNRREEWKKICCNTFLCRHKFHKIENYFSFEVPEKKIRANFQRFIELFTQEIVTKLWKIWVWDPRSGIQWSKRHRVPDPGSGSGSATLLQSFWS